MNNSTPASPFLITSGGSSASNVTTEEISRRGARATKSSTRTKQRIEAAVYAYIRAIRALDRTRINTEEVAEALNLSVDKVNRAIAGLRKKGVRVAR